MHALVEHPYTPASRASRKRRRRKVLERHTSPKRRKTAALLRKRMREEHKDDVQETLVDIVQSLRLCKDQVFEMVQAGGLHDVFERRLTFVRGTDTMCDDHCHLPCPAHQSDTPTQSACNAPSATSAIRSHMRSKDDHPSRDFGSEQGSDNEDAYDSSMLPDEHSEAVPELGEAEFAKLLREVAALGRGPGFSGSDGIEHWTNEDPREGIGPNHPSINHPSSKHRRRVCPTLISSSPSLCSSSSSKVSSENQSEERPHPKSKRRVVPTVLSGRSQSTLNESASMRTSLSEVGRPPAKRSAARTKADVHSEVLTKKKLHNQPVPTNLKGKQRSKLGSRSIDRNPSRAYGLYAVAFTDCRVDRSRPEKGSLSLLKNEQRERKQRMEHGHPSVLPDSPDSDISNEDSDISEEPSSSMVRRSQSLGFRTPVKKNRLRREPQCRSAVRLVRSHSDLKRRGGRPKRSDRHRSSSARCSSLLSLAQSHQRQGQ